MPHVSHRGLTFISVHGTEDLSCHSEGECRLYFEYSKTADWAGGHLIFLIYLPFSVFTRTYFLNIYKKEKKNYRYSFLRKVSKPKVRAQELINKHLVKSKNC